MNKFWKLMICYQVLTPIGLLTFFLMMGLHWLGFEMRTMEILGATFMVPTFFITHYGLRRYWNV